MDEIEQYDLITLWLRKWFSHGFIPTILSRSDARFHPNYKKWSSKLSKLPTVNPASYELSCYLRWIAFSAVGGGILTDFDIYPIGENISIPSSVKPCGLAGPLETFESFLPMFSFGGSKAIDNFIDSLANYKPNNNDRHQGRMHVSDMFISRKNGRKNYQKIHSWVPDLFHFSHADAHAHLSKLKWTGLTRSRWANRLIQLHWLNTHRLYIIGDLNEDFKKMLGPLFFCGNVKEWLALKPSKLSNEKIFPNMPFLCQVKQISTLKEISHFEKDNTDTNIRILFFFDFKSGISDQLNFVWNDGTTLSVNDDRILFAPLEDFISSKLLIEYTYGFTLPGTNDSAGFMLSGKWKEHSDKFISNLPLKDFETSFAIQKMTLAKLERLSKLENQIDWAIRQ